MKLLMVGSDSRGAWQMRAVQLGRALGARVTQKPTRADWLWADLVVMVKRAAIELRYDSRSTNAQIVWDALDYWEQPEQNGHDINVLVSQLRAIGQRFGYAQLIGATEAMAKDIDGVYMTHHCRLGLKPTPPRDKALVVGYDGTRKYLGAWLKALMAACDRLGLQFVLHPPDLSKVDVLVSFRDGRWDGEVCRRWKSGVKYVNAICAGRPILSQRSSAFDELNPVGLTLEDRGELVAALEYAIKPQVREQAYSHGLARAKSFTVESVATQYRSLLENALKVAA